MGTDPTGPANRWLNTPGVHGEEYDSRYSERASAGENVHGEADFVESLHPRSVLDAGCGTGRVGIELARRGIDMVGVDIDPRLLNTARKKAPDMPWHLADLSKIDLHRQFDVIVMAGNVMIFLAPGTEGDVLRNLARHLAPDGSLVAGFQLSVGYLSLADYDRLATEAGLTLAARYSTWEGASWSPEDNYAVSVHRHNGGKL